MKKRYTEQQFERVVNEAVRKTLKRRLNEGFDDFDNYDTGFDDFTAHDPDEEDSLTNDYLKSIERKNQEVLKQHRQNSSEEMDSKRAEELINAGSGEFDFDFDSEGEEDEIGTSSQTNELYLKAMDDLEKDNGRTNMNAWVEERVEEGSDREDAENAFKSAKAEYEKESSEYETDYTSSFGDREISSSEPEHQEGNVIEYDGVEIKDDGRQYVMVAKENDPQITIKGSNLKDVESTYDSLWRDMGSMEDRARKMGMTVYRGAMLWNDDYDKYVRGYGGHEEGLPIVIDLDKSKSRYSKTSSSQNSENGQEQSWLEPYMHEINGKYMMTPYQISRLSPDQRAEWDSLAAKYPDKYKVYSEAPSTGKINRNKKQ